MCDAVSDLVLLPIEDFRFQMIISKNRLSLGDQMFERETLLQPVKIGYCATPKSSEGSQPTMKPPWNRIEICRNVTLAEGDLMEIL